MSQKSNNPRRCRKTVPPGALARIIEAELAYTREVNAHRVVYPRRDQLTRLTPDKIRSLGFVGHSLEHLGVEPMDGRGESGEQGRERCIDEQLPDPDAVEADTVAALAKAGVTPVTGTGNVVSLHWDIECVTEEKVRHFARAYRAIFQCCDVAYLTATSRTGIEALANLLGYRWLCSTEHSPGTAVGLVYNPARFQFIGTQEAWDAMAEVEGIPDLRSVLALRS